jgi:hypothetical protein
MTRAPGAAGLYVQLAEWYERRGDARQRDLFLALAADAALHQGQPEQAERFRQRLLQHSPYHLLRPYATFADAQQSPDVVDYLNDLRQQYPPHQAQQLLEGLRTNAASSVGALVDLAPSIPGPGEAADPRQPRRQPQPSPYAVFTQPVAVEGEGPSLTWVPGAVFLLALGLSLAWGGYVFVAPFLDA